MCLTCNDETKTDAAKTADAVAAHQGEKTKKVTISVVTPWSWLAMLWAGYPWPVRVLRIAYHSSLALLDMVGATSVLSWVTQLVPPMQLPDLSNTAFGRAYARHAGSKTFEGCGCNRKLKRSWLRVVRFLVPHQVSVRKVLKDELDVIVFKN